MAYDNAAKVALAGVPGELIERAGAVSPEVAAALADGALERFGADVGIGITGIAGPGGGTPEKPVGTVCLCLAERDGERIERTLTLPGDRATVRERTDHGRDAPPAAAAGGLTLRLFVALDLPPGARAALAAFRDAAADPAVWRPVPDEALHLTLAFLGQRPEQDVAAIERVLAVAAGPAPRLRLGGALLLPPRRARVLCAEVEDLDGTLAELQARVSAGLAREGLYTPEKRPFRAHATVARLRPGERPPRALEAAPEPLEFHGEALTLYVSRLRPTGARYEKLARLSISADGPPG